MSQLLHVLKGGVAEGAVSAVALFTLVATEASSLGFSLLEQAKKRAQSAMQVILVSWVVMFPPGLAWGVIVNDQSW